MRIKSHLGNHFYDSKICCCHPWINQVHGHFKGKVVFKPKFAYLLVLSCLGRTLGLSQESLYLPILRLFTGCFQRQLDGFICWFSLRY